MTEELTLAELARNRSDVGDDEGPHTVDRPFVEPADMADILTAPVALIGEGRIDTSVTHHMPAADECRAHHFMSADAPVPQPERNHSTHHTRKLQ